MVSRISPAVCHTAIGAGPTADPHIFRNGFLPSSPYEKATEKINKDIEEIEKLALQHPDSNIRTIDGIDYAFTGNGWVKTDKKGGDLAVKGAVLASKCDM